MCWLDAFLGYFGLHLGGVLEHFFSTFWNIFRFTPTFYDLVQFWRAKLVKFARHGGLEMLEWHFGFYFRGYFASNGMKFGVILNQKWVDIANGA